MNCLSPKTMDATYLGNLIFLSNVISGSKIRTSVHCLMGKKQKSETKFVCNRRDTKTFLQIVHLVPFDYFYSVTVQNKILKH